MIPEIAELTVFLSMFVTVNLLRHNPTVKAESKSSSFDEMSYGFLGYPVSQAADITFCKMALLSETPRLIGTDGKAKMSKSLGNTISLAARPKLADEILASGTQYTRCKARETMNEVREAMSLNYFDLPMKPFVEGVN